MNGVWSVRSTVLGEEWMCGDWLVQRLHGDTIFNVFRNGKVWAVGFPDAESAKRYCALNEPCR